MEKKKKLQQWRKTPLLNKDSLFGVHKMYIAKECEPIDSDVSINK